MLRTMLKEKFYIVAFFSLLITFGCKISSHNFEEELSKIDLLKDTEDVEVYLSKLQKLKDKASGTQEFLSIAKREYYERAYKATFNTLLKAIKKTKDARVIAFLTFLATETKMYEVAMPYVEQLFNTAYETFALEFLFKNANVDIKQKMNFNVLMAAFKETKTEAFLVDAALSLIANGRLKDALSLRSLKVKDSSEYPAFWAELAFDTGDFSVIFDELKYSIASYDLHGFYDTEITKKTKAHILLAADGYYGLGKIEMARAYWQLYADMFYETNPLVFYNLALTTTDVLDRTKSILECIKNFPSFYPAIASYVRDYITYNRKLCRLKKEASLAQTEVERFLQEKELYSKDMEEFLLQDQFFVLKPKLLLKEKAQQFDDPRFALELLRYNIMEEPNFQKHAGDLWNTLESNPRSPITRKFAKWYFSKLGQFDTAFEVEKTGDLKADAFYDGLQASLSGDSAKALKSYEVAFSDIGFACAAYQNYACTKALLGESDDAIKAYTVALKHTESNLESSKIHFRIAEILCELREYERAKGVLQYALQLDNSNYLAENLLRQISN